MTIEVYIGGLFLVGNLFLALTYVWPKEDRNWTMCVFHVVVSVLLVSSMVHSWVA